MIKKSRDGPASPPRRRRLGEINDIVLPLCERAWSLGKESLSSTVAHRVSIANLNYPFFGF
jgi:hypothetical protein